VADRQFTTVPGAVSCRFQVIPKRKFAEAFLRRLGTLIDYPVVKYHDADGGFLCPPLPVFLEEDIRYPIVWCQRTACSSNRRLFPNDPHPSCRAGRPRSLYFNQGRVLTDTMQFLTEDRETLRCAIHRPGGFQSPLSSKYIDIISYNIR
jgi:hypothetical protein